MLSVVIASFNQQEILPDAIKSVLAHELSHYEIILNMSFVEKIKFGFKWLFTKKEKIIIFHILK